MHASVCCRPVFQQDGESKPSKARIRFLLVVMQVVIRSCLSVSQQENTRRWPRVEASNLTCVNCLLYDQQFSQSGCKGHLGHFSGSYQASLNPSMAYGYA